MAQSRLWFARIVMIYALLTFTFLAALYIFEPQNHIAKFGVSISGVPESINFLRAGPGAMFTTLALTSLYGLVRPQHFLTCLWFVVVLNACVVAARLYGMTVDGISTTQLTELRDEGFSWIAFALALFVYPRSR
jgi:hypothetical protein